MLLSWLRPGTAASARDLLDAGQQARVRHWESVPRDQLLSLAARQRWAQSGRLLAPTPGLVTYSERQGPGALPAQRRSQYAWCSWWPLPLRSDLGRCAGQVPAAGIVAGRVPERLPGLGQRTGNVGGRDGYGPRDADMISSPPGLRVDPWLYQGAARLCRQGPFEVASHDYLRRRV
jgi:hypothetical protein